MEEGLECEVVSRNSNRRRQQHRAFRPRHSIKGPSRLYSQRQLPQRPDRDRSVEGVEKTAMLIPETPPIEPLPYPELWILERPIEEASEIYLDWILHPDDFTATGYSLRWSAPVIGGTVQQLAQTLWKLWRRGDVVLSTGYGTAKVVSNPNGIDQVEDWFAPDSQMRLSYSISPRGIERWERHAMPDWDRYLSHWDEIESDNRQVIGETVWSNTATSEMWARRCLQNYVDYRTAHYAVAHWENAYIERFAPYIPIPGKILPEGIRVTVPVMNYGSGREREVWPPPCFQYVDSEAEWKRSEDHWKERVDLARWYSNGTMYHPDRPSIDEEPDSNCCALN